VFFCRALLVRRILTLRFFVARRLRFARLRAGVLDCLFNLIVMRRGYEILPHHIHREYSFDVQWDALTP
jgi:hypothetical protein